MKYFLQLVFFVKDAWAARSDITTFLIKTKTTEISKSILKSISVLESVIKRNQSSRSN